MWEKGKKKGTEKNQKALNIINTWHQINNHPWISTTQLSCSCNFWTLTATEKNVAALRQLLHV
jgi:hypothetical protein